MPRRPPPLVIGIIASARGGTPDVPLEVRQAAQRRGIELRSADTAFIGRILGSAFSQFPAWLILFAEDDDADVLMVPYPDQFAGVQRSDDARRGADNLFESIRADRNGPWSSETGRQGLVAAQSRGRLPIALKCFHVIRLPAPLRDYVGGVLPAGAIPAPQATAERIVDWFGEAAEKIDGTRQALRESLEGDDTIRADRLRDSFDATLMAEAVRLADRARGEHIVREPPLLAFLRNELGSNGLDPESLRFLETALLVEEMAVQVPGHRLDFSAAACPLWKVVELETNLSVGWLVRLLRQVASQESGRIARPDRDPGDRVLVATGREFHQRVELNERIPEDLPRLKGLMLGPMRYILAFAGENGIRDEILGQPFGGEWTRESLERFLFDARRRSTRSLQNALLRICDLRNRHAHDTAMDRDKYDKLKALVLGASDTERASSLVGRLVALKIAIEWLASGPHSS